MDDKNRITVLMGAGAMLDIFPDLSCNLITESVIETRQSYLNGSRSDYAPLLKWLYLELETHYLDKNGNCSVNFEDVFHALEMLESLKMGEDRQAMKQFRSTFGAICNLKEEFVELPKNLIYSAMIDLIGVVMEKVGSHESEMNKAPWFSKFFRELENRTLVDVFNLNYDTWVEQSLEKYTDGFYFISEQYKGFNAPKFFQDVRMTSSVNHLHGQVCFKPNKPTGVSKEIYSPYYKANNYNIAVPTGNVRGSLSAPYMQSTQSGEHVYQFPIITGLRKNDKISVPPFDAYEKYLYQCLLENKNLLVIGYGCGDLYVNHMLEQFHDFHRDDGKLVFVDYLNESKWNYRVRDLGLAKQTQNTLHSILKDTEFPEKSLGENFCDCIDSPNGKGKLYLCGFRKTAENYANDIINFFMSNQNETNGALLYMG